MTFRYPDGGENVLEHFSLHIPQGTTVAIVGETGAGKSTLINLACRFFEPTEGHILIDGVDYRRRSQLWLHSNIGYVLQNPHLFSGSVRENIRYGKLDATDEEVEAATYAHGSNEMPPRNVVEDLSAVEEMMKRNITGLDIVGALSRSGFEDIASNILNMLRQRVTGDYLQTSAILDRQFEVVSAVNDINDYQGPGTGYRISAERWAEIKNIPGVVQPDTIE